MNSKSIRPRTSISTDNLPAVMEPPTVIIEDKMQLDPMKVIKAWHESAEVLKTVAQAAQEAQEDNAYTRETLEHSRKVMIRLGIRSEEHTSELQSRENLVCRLLLEKKKQTKE